MATTKLTLAVEPQTIECAKKYAAKHKTSVSALFSRYINALTAQEQGGDFSIPHGSIHPPDRANCRSTRRRNCSRYSANRLFAFPQPTVALS